MAKIQVLGKRRYVAWFIGREVPEELAASILRVIPWPLNVIVYGARQSQMTF
jgi:hypothetical protein